jgi:hypothetical protein
LAAAANCGKVALAAFAKEVTATDAIAARRECWPLALLLGVGVDRREPGISRGVFEFETFERKNECTARNSS